MNKKISLGLAISLIIIAATVSFAMTMTVSRQMYNKLIIDLPNRLARYEVVNEIADLLNTNYYSIKILEESGQSNLNNSIANGCMKGLNDKSCSFMTADDYKIYAKILEGKFPDSGIKQIQNSKTGYMNVTSVTANSLAANKGIQKGDEIIKINNKIVTAKTYVDLAKELDGYNKKTIDITFRRNGKDKNISVQIGSSAQSVFYKTIEDIGYVKITAFYKNTIDQFNKAISALKKQGVENIIFDVRSNSEGDIKYAAEVIDAIVPIASEGTGAIVTIVDRDGKTIDSISSDSNTLNMEMAVLVNSNTSGCAEVFAQDLKDFKSSNVTLIGEKTAGNWSKQEVFRLKDGNYIKMTIAKMLPYITDPYTPNKDGKIVPEIVVSLSDENGNNFDLPDITKDPQIKAAFDYLKGAQVTNEKS
ncbi:MAG: S41 family peptidase [Eubacteriales bacterium]